MENDLNFVFGKNYAAFFVEPNQNVLHQNVAFQIVVSATDDITVVDENNEKYVGKIVLIKPLTLSKIQCDGLLTHLYLSPVVDFSLNLMSFIGDANIHILDSAQDLLPFSASSTRAEIIDVLEKHDQFSTKQLDSRLKSVLDILDRNLDNASISNAAKHSGLSRSRIRTLAREQIGVPISTWVTWRKLVKANKALSDGADLTDAALAGNFSDLAHFSRTMRRMFGVTPTTALMTISSKSD